MKDILLREVAERKKGLIFWGIKESNIPLNTKIEREKMKVMKGILQKLNDTDEKIKSEEEIGQVTRVGKYKMKETKSMKVTS